MAEAEEIQLAVFKLIFLGDYHFFFVGNERYKWKEIGDS